MKHKTIIHNPYCFLLLPHTFGCCPLDVTDCPCAAEWSKPTKARRKGNPFEAVAWSVFDMWMILEYFITYDRNIGQVKPSAGPCWHLQSPPRAWHMVCTVETNWVVMQGKQVATLSFEILLHLFCLNICVDWSRLQIQSRSKNLNEIARPQVFLKLLASVKFRLWQWHLWHRKQVMSVIAMLCQSVTRCIFLQADLCTFTLFFLKIEQAKTASFPTSSAVQSEWKMVETHRKRSTQQGAGVLWTNQLYSTILIENTVQSVAKHKVCLFEVSSI